MSAAKIEANRQKPLFFTGSASVEDKAVSSRSVLFRHGLCASTFSLTNAHPRILTKLLTTKFSDTRPQCVNSSSKWPMPTSQANRKSPRPNTRSRTHTNQKTSKNERTNLSSEQKENS